MTTTPIVAARTSPPWIRFLLINFVVYNPLYAFSVMLVLGGAWLLNPPSPTGGRDLGLLLKLFGAIQLYELTLLVAGGILARRGNLRRDVRFLMLVLYPFLLDMTFTLTALVGVVQTQLGTLPALLLAATVLALTALKVLLAQLLAGLTFQRGDWVALLAGPSLVLLYPVVAGALALNGLGGDGVTLLGGLLIGGLALLLAHVGPSTWVVERWPNACSLDLWGVRRIALLPLGVGLLHVLATTYSHSGDSALVLGPLLIAGGVALPRLAWPQLAEQDRFTPLVLPVFGAIVCGLNTSDQLGISAWNLGLLGVCALHAILFVRTRSLGFLAGAILALHFTWGGDSIQTSVAALGHNPLEPVLLLALFVLGVRREVRPGLLAVPLTLAALLTGRLDLLGGPLNGLLALDVIGAGMLFWTHHTHGDTPRGVRFRLAGSLLIYLPAYALLLGAGDTAHTVTVTRWAWSAVAGLAVLGALRGCRLYLWPVLLIPLEGAIHLAPSTTAGWGALGIGSAFLVVSAGVWVSLHRERLLALLGDGPGDDSVADAGG